MVNIILLIFGGAFGAFMNTFVMQMVYNIVVQPSPRTVLLVNVVSCFTIGFASIFHYSQSLHFNTRLMLVLGLCGGFVVCSAFTRGNSTLLKSGLSTTTLLYFFCDHCFRHRCRACWSAISQHLQQVLNPNLLLDHNMYSSYCCGIVS